MAERHMTERTFDRKIIGRMDMRSKHNQPKRHMTERQMAEPHKFERTFGRKLHFGEETLK